MVAGIISETRPGSNRNADRDHLGIRIEAGKSPKQRRTAKQMHLDLVALGYEFVPAANAAGGPVLWSRPVAGTIRLLVNGQPVGEGSVQQFPTTIAAFAESFDIGQDRNSPVGSEAEARQRFDQPLGETHLELK